jgi:predicted ArsR family transcriptional regulator
VSLTTAERDDTDGRVLRCLLFGRRTLDLLCDSLDLQCHQVRDSLDGLQAAGLVRRSGDGGTAELEFDLTGTGRERAVKGVGRG